MVVVLPLLVLGAFPAAAQQTGNSDAREGLLKTDKEWAQAAGTKDLERIVSYWTDDAVILSPGEAPVEGKDAIRKWVGGSLEMPDFAVTWTPVRVEVSESGDLGYTIGDNAFTIPLPDGGTTQVKGRYVTVWRKGADGKWRCVIDIWNPAPAPSTPPEE